MSLWQILGRSGVLVYVILCCLITVSQQARALLQCNYYGLPTALVPVKVEEVLLGILSTKFPICRFLQGRECDASSPGALLIFLLKHRSEAAPSDLRMGFQGVFLQLLSQSLVSDSMAMNLPPC